MNGTRQKLFVYGTLKRGYCRAHALAGQRFLGTARTTSKYRLYDCGDYPGLVRAADGKRGRSIVGELWNIDESCLPVLDEMEGVSAGLYERAAVHLQPPHDGEYVVSYFYRRSVQGLRDCGSHWP